MLIVALLPHYPQPQGPWIKTIATRIRASEDNGHCHINMLGVVSRCMPLVDGIVFQSILLPPVANIFVLIHESAEFVLKVSKVRESLQNPPIAQ